MRHKNRIRTRKKLSSTSKLFVEQFPTRQRSKMNPQKDFNVDRQQKSEYSSIFMNTKRDYPVLIFNEFDFPHEPPILLTNDPKELHHLLLCKRFYFDNKNYYSKIFIVSFDESMTFYIRFYFQGYIETLHKDPNFERIRDPVKELFDSHETKSIPELDSSQPAKKVCIIFHGAPFTGNFVF